MQMTFIAIENVKVGGKEVILKADQNLHDCSDKKDERNVKILLEMLENHYRYPFVFDADDFYSNWKLSKSVEKKLFWKLIKIFLIAQTTEYQSGPLKGLSNWHSPE